MDRLQLMLEADRRGLLQPEQKAMLDEAVKRGLLEKPAAVSVGEELMKVPRQVGLTVRHGMEGLGEVVGIGSEPIRAVVNPGLRAVGLPEAGSARDAMSSVADLVGLPKPENANERVVGDVTRMMTGAGGIASGARKISEVVSGPVAKSVTAAMGENAGQQVVAGATAGGAGGAVREAGGGPWAQFGASLLGGLGGAGAASVGVKVFDGIANAVRGFLTPKATMQEINVTLNQVLEQNGVDVAQVSGNVRSELAKEVQRALQTGRQLNPDVVRRIADYGVVGATPTRGTVTLDPVQITQEKNLAKVGANSTDPKLQQLARVQNTNNARLIENLNEMGGNTPNANPVTAGRAVVETIRKSDDAAKSVEKGLYSKARDSSGRALDLDSEGFVSNAYAKLAESNKGAFLPENIKAVLDQLRTGKVTMGGKEYPAPFTVDTIDNLKTMISTAQRGASDGNVRAALSQVRNALEEVQPKAVGKPVGGNQVVDPAKLASAQAQADEASTAAMKAFDEARSYAKSRRDWQESAPGIKAALDDIEPDTFVREYIISNTQKSATAHVEKLLHELHGAPEAQQAVKQQVVAYLKNKALGGAADEVGNFSQSNYNSALRELGDMKLRILFSPDEISKLKAIGRVASYETVQPRGSAVNNSNTAGTFVGILEKIADSPLVGRIPFGDAAVRTPARNWAAQIGVKRAVDATDAVAIPRNADKTGTIAELLGPGLLLAAPKSEGGNKEKRR